MKRNKFRFYSTVPYNIQAYSEDLKVLGAGFDNEWYGNVEKVENSEMELILPKQYWREGTYLFAHLKTGRNEERTGLCRTGMFGYSEYQGLFFYEGEWFKTETTESELERLDLHQPGEKEYEFMMKIPQEYLNRYYKCYQHYIWWAKEIHRTKRNAKLARFRILGK